MLLTIYLILLRNLFMTFLLIAVITYLPVMELIRPLLITHRIWIPIGVIIQSNSRWGIERSFRKLKYTIGLTNFHAKKVEYILQEIFFHG